MNGKDEPPNNAPEKAKNGASMGWRRWLRRHHYYYLRRGIYNFIGRNSWKLVLTLGLLLGGLWLFNKYVLKLDYLVCEVFPLFPKALILGVFLLSESFLSLLSPDIFILWSKSTKYPYLIVGLLAALSYLGGIISYTYGRYLYRVPRIQRWIVKRYASYLAQLRKYGGLLVALAALTPLPFSPICAISGIVGFPFRSFLLVMLVRIVRFFVYAYLLFSMGLIKEACV